MQESLHLIEQQIWLNEAHNHKYKDQAIFSFVFGGPLSGRIFARHLLEWKNSYDV
jgi:hypothetical protein